MKFHEALGMQAKGVPIYRGTWDPGIVVIKENMYIKYFPRTEDSVLYWTPSHSDLIATDWRLSK